MTRSLVSILIMLFVLCIFFCLLLSNHLNDVPFTLEYHSNWTYDWTKESELGTEKEVKDGLEIGLVMSPVQYPFPLDHVKNLRDIAFLS